MMQELLEAKEKEEAEEAKRKATQEVEEAQAKAKAQAAERAAAQKQQEAERAKENAAKKAAEKDAACQAKKYVEEGHACVKRLEELHRHTTEILDSPDPAVKKIRMQVRREVSAALGSVPCGVQSC
jgi:nucleoporin GLE1